MDKLNLINTKHASLSKHSIYENIKCLEDLQVFMKWHVFAVWDFMSLLKSLQREITCVTVPWRPSHYSKDLVRFINEIVVGEESDLDIDGNYNDHFSMYLQAMKEAQAPTGQITDFLATLNSQGLPKPVSDFVNFNLELALSNSFHNVASAFFWGRENLIPDIFEPMVKVIDDEKLDAPHLKYYLERHIELDGDEHGDLARKCLEELCQSPEQYDEALDTAIVSLEYRSKMWDFIANEIQMSRSKGHMTL